jgi:hypothetical protein
MNRKHKPLILIPGALKLLKANCDLSLPHKLTVYDENLYQTSFQLYQCHIDYSLIKNLRELHLTMLSILCTNSGGMDKSQSCRSRTSLNPSSIHYALLIRHIQAKQNQFLISFFKDLILKIKFQNFTIPIALTYTKIHQPNQCISYNRT